MENSVKRDAAKAEKDVKPILNFWNKVNNDWAFNLSGLLAYNFLMSIFPILLTALAILGFTLGAISPSSVKSIENGIGGALPGGGHTIVTAVLASLRKSAGLIFIIGLVSSIFAGSRLFIVLENCMGIIFRLRGRTPIRQNVMAVLMLLLYIVLIPFVFFASIIPSAIISTLDPHGTNPAGNFMVQALGIIAAFIGACLLFGAIYVVVPNRPVQWREVWKGTLVAAGLLLIYQLIFPFYESYFLKPQNYGSLAGFAIVILVFFYYLAFILLLGAEVNSWASGQRETLGDLAAMIHEVQAHGTTRGIAGPTAGLPQEDLQHRKGAQAMRDAPTAVRHEHDDHHTDIKPPMEATANDTGQQRINRANRRAGQSPNPNDGTRKDPNNTNNTNAPSPHSPSDSSAARQGGHAGRSQRGRSSHGSRGSQAASRHVSTPTPNTAYTAPQYPATTTVLGALAAIVAITLGIARRPRRARPTRLPA
ncbi:MAG: YihY/virulence factor BrkB family protein [Ktedonobacterales bacterium]